MKEPKRMYKDVVIIGNGPSALALSYLLSGHAAVFNGGTHPDPLFNLCLQTVLGPSNGNLTATDLTPLTQMMEVRGSSPTGALIDKLLRPSPLLSWSDAKPVSHAIIGKGPVGGAWRSMPSTILTVSPSSWMELPGLKFPGGSRRVRPSDVSAYYTQYASCHRLLSHVRRGTVTSISPLPPSPELSSGDEDEGLWLVHAKDSCGRSFSYVAKHVVLAVGSSDVPNRLGVAGEDSPRVYHRSSDLYNFLAIEEMKRRQNEEDEADEPILVVGSGLSAADAVLTTLRRGFKVVHIHRPSALNGVPYGSYPEYDTAKRLVDGTLTDTAYDSLPGAELVHFSTSPFSAVIQNAGQRTERRFMAAAVLIGSSPDLSFLPELAGRRIQVNPKDYSVKGYDNLWAVGPLAGDMFVRFVLGGAIVASSQIRQKLNK